MKKEFNHVPVREKHRDYQCPNKDIETPRNSSLVLTVTGTPDSPFLDWSTWAGDPPFKWSIWRSNPDGTGVILFSDAVVGSSFPILNATGDFLYWMQGFDLPTVLGGLFPPATPVSNRVLVPKPLA